MNGGISFTIGGLAAGLLIACLIVLGCAVAIGLLGLMITPLILIAAFTADFILSSTVLMEVLR